MMKNKKDMLAAATVTATSFYSPVSSVVVDWFSLGKNGVDIDMVLRQVCRKTFVNFIVF